MGRFYRFRPLPKPYCQRVVWQQFKELMALTKQSEKGCIRAHTLKQIEHPFARGKSEYTIMLFQEYIDIAAFEQHCQTNYVKRAFKHWIEDPKTAIVEKWRVTLLCEEEYQDWKK